MFSHIDLNCHEVHPLPLIYFISVGSGTVIEPADHDMIIFVFVKTIIELRVIDKLERLSYFAIESHFFAKPSPRSFFDRFTWPRMPAARVGPEALGVIFGTAPLLQQQSASGIKDVYGECPM